MSQRRCLNIGLGSLAICAATFTASPVVADTDGVDRGRPATTSAIGEDNPHPDDRADPTTVAQLQNQFGFSEEEAHARFRAENEASRLSVILSRNYKKDLAGIWMEVDGSTSIHVSFIGDWKRSTAEVRALSKLPDSIVGHAANVSLAELEATVATIVKERTELQNDNPPQGLPEGLRRTEGAYDVDIDMRANAILLFADNVDPQSLSAEVEERYHRPARVKEEKPASPALCASREDCRFEMRGGISLNPVTCSSGFIAQSLDGIRRFMLSAAHCGGNNVNDVGAQRTNGGSYYGTVHGNFQSDKADVERIINDVTDTINWINTNPVFLDPGNYRQMTGYTSYAGIVVGTTTYGKSGRATGNTQGFVQSKSISPSYVPSGNSFIRTNMCIQVGDSGGAVYRQNNAVGLVSGATQLPCADPNFYGIFSSIEYAIQRANVALSG